MEGEAAAAAAERTVLWGPAFCKGGSFTPTGLHWKELMSAVVAKTINHSSPRVPFDWDFLPGGLPSPTLWHPESRTGPRTSWFRCLPVETLSRQTDNIVKNAASWADILYIKQNESYVLNTITLMICTGWSAVQQQLLNNDYHTNSTTLIFSVHTSYAFLQAFIEGTGADLQQQRRWEPVERFDFPQSGQYDVHILSRALRRPVQKDKQSWETGILSFQVRIAGFW